MARIFLIFLVAVFADSLALNEPNLVSFQLPLSGAHQIAKPTIKLSVDTTVFTAGTNYTEKCSIEHFQAQKFAFTVGFGLKTAKRSLLDGDQELGIYAVNGPLNTAVWGHLDAAFDYGSAQKGTVSESLTEFTGLVRLAKDLPKGARLYCALSWFEGIRFHYVESKAIVV